jgi:hypothetical protein
MREIRHSDSEGGAKSSLSLPLFLCWNPARFFELQLSEFLTGYYRNRQQSQPNHIEIIAEKLTVRTILSSVADKYSIPSNAS